MSVKDLLIHILETAYTFPVLQQGSMTDHDSYPDSFFTFWNNDVPSACHYDNEPSKYIWDFDLNFYSSNPELVNTKLEEAINELKKYGFIPNGKGHDVISDESTFTGRGINVIYEEREDQL